MKSETIVFVIFFYSFLVFSIPVLAADIVAENSSDSRNHRALKNLTEIKGPPINFSPFSSVIAGVKKKGSDLLFVFPGTAWPLI